MHGRVPSTNSLAAASALVFLCMYMAVGKTSEFGSLDHFVYDKQTAGKFLSVTFHLRMSLVPCLVMFYL